VENSQEGLEENLPAALNDIKVIRNALSDPFVDQLWLGRLIRLGRNAVAYLLVDRGDTKHVRFLFFHPTCYFVNCLINYLKRPNLLSLV
jgi:hypothetical protein